MKEGEENFLNESVERKNMAYDEKIDQPDIKVKDKAINFGEILIVVIVAIYWLTIIFVDVARCIQSIH